MHSGGNQAGDMRHVDHHHRPDLIGDLPKGLKIDGAGVGAGADDDQLGLMFPRQPFHFIVIDGSGFLFDPIGNDIEKLAGEIDRRTVGQMPAVGQVHAEHRIARLTDREIDRHVRLGAGMGLDVGMLGAEKLLGAVDRQLFGHIDELAAAVIALPGISLGVFVGQNRTLGLENPLADEILRRDEFQAVFLPLGFPTDGRGYFGIESFEFSQTWRQSSTNKRSYDSRYRTKKKRQALRPACLNRSRLDASRP